MSEKVIPKCMMGKLGQIEAFQKGENFESYSERVNSFFKANAIKEAEKTDTFITIIGPSAYETLKTLCSPEKPNTKEFNELVLILKHHYAPKKIITAERSKFYERKQKEGESIADFVEGLHQLASSCNFPANFLQEALRDKFVCGIANMAVRSELLSKDHNFTRAVEVAQGMEAALTQATQLDSASTSFIREEAAVYQVKPKCTACGWFHPHGKCRAEKWECFTCKKKGHVAKMCRSRPKEKRGKPKKYNKNNHTKVLFTEETSADSSGDSSNDINTIAYAGGRKVEAYKIKMRVQGKLLEMEVDTGAVVTVIPKRLWMKSFKKIPLRPYKEGLNTYSGESLPILGVIKVDVVYKEQQVKQLPMVVIDDRRRTVPVLLGRNWLQHIVVDLHKLIKGVNVIQNTSSRLGLGLEMFKARYPQVFDKKEGKIKKFRANIVVKEGAQPIFCKAYSVPFAVKEKVEKEINRQVKAGILVPVQSSEWASPVLAVAKEDGGIRLCGDFKVSVNRVSETAHYPLPTFEDLSASWAGSKFFTKLDLANAYQQLEVSDSSKQFLTVNTHLGLFQYTRLVYGISSAPAIFQSVMDEVLKGLKGVCCYIDDVLITGCSEKECTSRVEAVLSRLNEYGFKLKEEKCEFLKQSVTFLGHTINEKGIHTNPEKVKALQEAPRPENVAQLGSYLGLLKYYSKFIPMMSSELKPLYELTEDNWNWSKEADKAFKKSKELILGAQVLTHFDPTKPIVVSADASAYGLGAVLSIVTDEGEKPVAFASRVLSKSEKNYAQVEKEALALIFAVKKFNKYILGARFLLVSDHLPLTAILGSKKGFPVLAAARMQRWAIILGAYNYDIQYRKGKEMAPADALSRLPLEGETAHEINYFSPSDKFPLNSDDIAQATSKDALLLKVFHLTLNGWPEYNREEQLTPYFSRRNELSINQGCVTWGDRVIIPLSLRDSILKLLHESHPGITRSKMLARQYVWWPNLDRDITDMINGCEICQTTLPRKVEGPVCQWPLASRFWERVHLDFCKKDDVTFLVLYDVYSKWFEAKIMRSTVAEKTLENLRSIFGVFGLPETIVVDNGPPFNSQDFESFCRGNGIQLTYSPPKHPQSNGTAERAVQTLKKALLKSVLEDKKLEKKRSVQHRLENFLFAYRNTPQTDTEIAPAELVFKQKPRTRLTYLKPDFGLFMEIKQKRRKESADKKKGKLFHHFIGGETVWVKNTRGEIESWVKGKIVKVISPVTYIAQVGGRWRFVHRDHLRASVIADKEVEIVEPVSTAEFERSRNREIETPVRVNLTPRQAPIDPSPKVTVSPSAGQAPIIHHQVPIAETATPVGPRRSVRERKPRTVLDL